MPVEPTFSWVDPAAMQRSFLDWGFKMNKAAMEEVVIAMKRRLSTVSIGPPSLGGFDFRKGSEEGQTPFMRSGALVESVKGRAWKLFGKAVMFQVVITALSEQTGAPYPYLLQVGFNAKLPSGEIVHVGPRNVLLGPEFYDATEKYGRALRKRLVESRWGFLVPWRGQKARPPMRLRVISKFNIGGATTPTIVKGG